MTFAYPHNANFQIAPPTHFNWIGLKIL